MMCLCRSCVRCLVCWWILDVMAVGLRQPTNRQQTTNNNQPTTHPKADTGATTNNQQPIDNRQPTITNQRATQKRAQERQPTTNNQSTNLPPISQTPTPMIPGAINPSSENRSSDGSAGCAEHLNLNITPLQKDPKQLISRCPIIYFMIVVL